MSSSQRSSKVEDLILNTVGGTASNLVPIAILAIVTFLGRFIRGAIDTVLLITTCIICVGIIVVFVRSRVQPQAKKISLKRAVILIVLTITGYYLSIETEVWCSYEPVQFIVDSYQDNQSLIVRNNRVQIKQNERLIIKLVANSKIEDKQKLGNDFICTWSSADKDRIGLRSGCLIWFDTNVTPQAPTNHAAVELRPTGCKRREQKVLAIDLSQ